MCLWLAHTYIRMFAIVCGMNLYIFTHISTVRYLEIVGRKKEDVREKEWVREIEIDCCNQNFFFFLILCELNLYFDLNMIKPFYFKQFSAP